MYPSQNISDEMKKKILDCTVKLALGIGIRGMINIQFIEYNGELYVIEVNPRASRTVPYISKVSGIPIVDIATRVMLGEKLRDMEYGVGISKEPPIVAVKVPVFSTQKLPNVEVSLGPEMRSTGEVLGISSTLSGALYKGFVAAGMFASMKKGVILATIGDHDKNEFLPIAGEIDKMGIKFMATKNTARLLRDNGIEVEEVRKMKEEHPNIIDVIKNEQVDMVINTPTKGNDSTRDGFHIRRAAVERNIEIITSIDTFRILVQIKGEKVNENELKVFCNCGIN